MNDTVDPRSHSDERNQQEAEVESVPAAGYFLVSTLLEYLWIEESVDLLLLGPRSSIDSPTTYIINT